MTPFFSLLAFYSTGFPLDKAIVFANKYKPFMINDLEMQKVIRDREKVIIQFHFADLCLLFDCEIDIYI